MKLEKISDENVNLEKERVLKITKAK